MSKFITNLTPEPRPLARYGVTKIEAVKILRRVMRKPDLKTAKDLIEANWDCGYREDRGFYDAQKHGRIDRKEFLQFLSEYISES